MSDRAPEPLVIQEDEALHHALQRHAEQHPDTLFRAETARGPVTGRIASAGGGYSGWNVVEPHVTLAPLAGGQLRLELRDLRAIYPIARIRPDGTPGAMHPRRDDHYLGEMQIFPKSYQGDPAAPDFLDRLRDYLCSQHRTPAMRLETAAGPRTVWITGIGQGGFMVRDLDAWDLGAFEVTPGELLDIYAEGVIAKTGGEVLAYSGGRVPIWRPDPACPGLAVDSLPPGARLDTARADARRHELRARLDAETGA